MNSELLTINLLTAVTITFGAGLMRGFAGVGSGMLMAPFFVLLFGPVETVATIIIMEIVVTVQLLPSVHRYINWSVVGPMGAAAAIFMPLGTWILVTLEPELIARAIGGVVLLFAIVLLSGWRYYGPKHMPVSMGVGALSGVLMASTSLGNPPVMVYLLSSEDNAVANRANFTGYFAVTLVSLIIWMTIRNLIGWKVMQLAAILLLPYMLAAWIGSKLFRKSSELLYRRVALILLVFAGFYGLLQ